MEKIVEEIIKKKKTCYFISPHLDDAVLSAGGLISYLAGKTEVIVVTVFTEAGNANHSLSAISFARQCGYKAKSIGELYSDRRNEDKKLFRKLRVEAIHLGIKDALWRQKDRLNLVERSLAKIVNEFRYIYPTYKWHIAKGEIAKADRKNMLKIQSLLKEMINEENSIVFCPIGLGDHVDHIMVREACKNIFSEPIFWEDYPYCLKRKRLDKFNSDTELNKVHFNKNQDKRFEMSNNYKTQVDCVLKGNVDFLPTEEKYFLKKMKNKTVKRKNKPTVSVGIPAHNEEKNIKKLINSVFEQSTDNFILEAVHVSCDGCTDKTGEIAKNLMQKYKKLKVDNDKKRLGKPERVNNFFKNSNSDIFISLDADIVLSDKNVIRNLVKKFDSPKVSLVAGLSLPMNSKNLIEKSAAVASRLWYEVRRNLNEGDTIFNNVGRILALRKNAYKKLRFPKGMVADDEFLYVSIKQMGLNFKFAEDAVVYYKEPDNLKDYFKQSTRFLRYKHITANYFGKWVYSFYEVPKKFKRKALVKMLIREPIFLPLAVLLQTSLRLFQHFYEEKYTGSVWTTVKSTKERFNVLN